MVDILRLGGTEVATGKTRMFQYDSIRYPTLAQPPFQNRSYPTLLRQDWNQCYIIVTLGHIRKVKG